MPNIPLFKVYMSEDALGPVNEVLMSGYIGQGKKVDEFEKALSEHVGNPHVCTVNSGTSSLHLALRLVKDEIRDEVLTTPLTCTATNLPILANDLKIRWVDLDPSNCNLDLSDLRKKLSPRTLAIMVVHWGGYPVDLDELLDIQHECYRKYGFFPRVIEDCAHAFGATYKGKLLGSHGNLCCFSFGAIKHLTSVDGGLLVLPSEEMLERAKLLRWYGLDRTSSADFRCEQNICEWGYKFHMNDVNATIGLKNLDRVGDILKRHRENGRFYRETLAGVSGITLLESKPDRVSSEWIFTLRAERRNDFIIKMKELGVSCGRVHDRNDKHSCLSHFKEHLPNTDLVCSDMCCIPCGWWLSAEDREYIADCIKKGW